MREEGAVGGSVAGSTAGWWPSDRDRFPPRFLLPPSLQTHNCIISTHLASSSPRRSCPSGCCSPLSLCLSVSLSCSFSPPISIILTLSCSARPSLSSACQLSTHLLLDPTRCAPSHSSLVSSRSTGRSLGRPAASLSSPSSTSSSLLFRAKALPHARNGPPPLRSSLLPSAATRDAMLSLAPFCHSRAQQRLSRSVFHPFPPVCVSLSFSSPREAEVMTRIRFFILPSPPALRQPAASPPPSSLSSSRSLLLFLRTS